MELVFSPNEIALLTAAAQAQGQTVEAFVIAAALRQAGGDACASSSPPSLTVLAQRAVALAQARSANIPFRLSELVDGLAWWDELSGESQAQLSHQFRLAVLALGFTEFKGREPASKSIFIRMA